MQANQNAPQLWREPGIDPAPVILLEQALEAPVAYRLDHRRSCALSILTAQRVHNLVTRRR